MRAFDKLKLALRPHLNAPLGPDHPGNVLELLRTIVAFQRRHPVKECQGSPAALDIVVLDGTTSRERPRFHQAVLLSLWSAVLPWEAARGLSFTPAEALLPSVLLHRAEEIRAAVGPTSTSASTGNRARSTRKRGTLPPYPSTKQLAGDDGGERGMLFVQEHVDYRRPLCFWSGAICGPIDVAFIQRRDPYASLRSAMRDAVRGQASIPVNLSSTSIQPDGVELQVVDQSMLDPFDACDKVTGTPLEPLFDDRAAAVSVDALHDSPGRRSKQTDVTSNVHGVAMVMETRRRFFLDHINEAVGHAGGHRGDLHVLVCLKLSRALQDEVEEKQRLNRTMVKTLEWAVYETLRQSFVARDNFVDPQGEEDGSGSVRSPPQSSHVGDENPPRSNVAVSFVGRRSGAVTAPGDEGDAPQDGDSASSRRSFCEDATERSRFTSRYIESQPGLFELPKLHYELLVLAYMANICTPDIASLFPRIFQSLQEENSRGSRSASDSEPGGLSDHDISWLLHLANDPSLLVPQDLRSAIVHVAAARGLQIAAEVTTASDNDRK